MDLCASSRVARSLMGPTLSEVPGVLRWCSRSAAVVHNCLWIHRRLTCRRPQLLGRGGFTTECQRHSDAYSRVSPGARVRSSTSGGRSAARASGVPVNSGKVPK